MGVPEGESARPSGTVTFLFTDIEGSTRLWDEHPDLMRLALARHDELLRKAVESFDGFVFSTGGDGLAATFHRAADGVGAAVMAQRALSAEPWPEMTVLRVRMGVHTGEAEERDGDYFGSPVNRAARVMTAAQGGQVLVSSATAEVAGRVPGVDLVDLGLVRLRGQAEPVQVFGVAAAGLDPVARLASDSLSVAGNLPRPATEWFGPIVQVQQGAASLLSRRLVTLTGPGGVGKTRLAIETAWMVIDEFADGVWLIDLAPVADTGAVAASVASTLSVRPQEGMSTVESVVDWLRGRRLLLIVDNCEHVLGPASDLVGAIVTGVPTVTVLATSREPLGVPGERVVSVRSLASADAVALFCDRATAANEAVRFGEADVVAVTELCGRLDGIPLAIELAAARIRSLTAVEIRDRLGDRFRLLRGAGRGGVERHQTLRATVEWSYQLLDPSERLLFDRLSVFPGSFDLASAARVCANGDLGEFDVEDLVVSLVDKSMVLAEPGTIGTRYRLLETLRQYGEERLADIDQIDPLRDRHLHHYVELAERTMPIVVSSRQADGQAVMERDWDNLRAAFAHATAINDLDTAQRLLWATFPFAFCRLYYEHSDWVDTVVELDTADFPVDVAMFGLAAEWAFLRSDFPAAAELAHAGIDRAPTTDDRRTLRCWYVLGIAYYFDHKRAGWADAFACAEAASSWSAEHSPFEHYLFLLPVAVADVFESAPSAGERVARLTAFVEHVGAPSMLAGAKFVEAASSALTAGWGTDTSLALIDEGLRLARSVGDRANGGDLLAALCTNLAVRGRLDDTHTIHDALAELYNDRFWLNLWICIEAAALHLAMTGATPAAATALGHLSAHVPPLPWLEAARNATATAVQQHPEHQIWMANGTAMDRDQLATYLLHELSEAGRQSDTSTV